MEFFKKNLSAIILIIINIITVIVFVARLDARTAGNEENINRVEKKIDAHIADKSLHMPFEEKVEKFVLRNEYNQSVKEIRQDLREIKQDIKRLLERDSK